MGKQENIILIEGLKDLKMFAVEFAESLSKGDCVVLIGELGSGKTTFVKGVCRYFGIDNVTSPTFSIVNEYENNETIYHLDFYRIKHREELVNVGYYEIIEEEDAIKFIEWGNLFPEVLPSRRIELQFEISGNDKRKIKVKRYE